MDNGESISSYGNDSTEIQYFIDQMSEKYLAQIKDDRIKFDAKQVRDISELLKDWGDKIISSTKEILNTSQSINGSSLNSFDGVVEDIKDRQIRVIETIHDTHNRQMDILRAVISEERKEMSQAQLLFEQTLKTRYECMVDALHEKIKAEQEARMQRALDNLERSARIESERAKQSFDVQQEAEITLSKKFKSIVSDLRRSWEEEEVGRSLQLEERLRSHYSVVLEHMEAQLKIALQLQDHADQQWLEDVEGRNRLQLETFRSFEEKCKRMYDSRLTEFSNTFSQQISNYEDMLLESGKSLASEKSQFEGKLRRMKLACSRWKIAYQRDLQLRYSEMTAALEERYISEIDQLLQEIADMSNMLASTTHALGSHERNVLKTRDTGVFPVGVATASDRNSDRNSVINSGGAISTPSSAELRQELTTRWDELKTSPAERVDALVALLDASQVTPQMQTLYETLTNKLSARQPISQLINRKQYIEYKLKLSSRIGGDGTTLTASDRAQLITELTEIQTGYDQLVKQYERKFGESYSKPMSASLATGGSSSAQEYSASLSFPSETNNGKTVMSPQSPTPMMTRQQTSSSFRGIQTASTTMRKPLF